MNLEKHIEILLLWNDCVIIPELGGFTTSHIAARFDDDNMFIPPLRTLGFNPKLNVNDSLLVQSYSETYDISYPEALKKINEEVAEIKQQIDNDGEYSLNDIGTLYRTESGSIGFTPCEAGVLTPSLYGLSSFEMERIYPLTMASESMNTDLKPENTLHIDKKSFSQNENNDIQTSLDEEKTIKIRMSVINNVAAMIIAVIGFFVLANPISNSYSPIQLSKFDSGIISKLLSDDNIKSIDKCKSETLYKKDNVQAVAEHNIDNTKDKNVITSKVPYYCLVLACQVTKKNAKIYSERLLSEGYDGVKVLEEKNKSTKVIYGYYSTEADAYNALNELHGKEFFSQAWVYMVK